MLGDKTDRGDSPKKKIDLGTDACFVLPEFFVQKRTKVEQRSVEWKTYNKRSPF